MISCQYVWNPGATLPAGTRWLITQTHCLRQHNVPPTSPRSRFLGLAGVATPSNYDGRSLVLLVMPDDASGADRAAPATALAHRAQDAERRQRAGLGSAWRTHHRTTSPYLSIVS